MSKSTDFSSQLLLAKQSGAQVLGDAGNDAVNIVKQASEFGNTPGQTVAGLITYISQIHTRGLPATQGYAVHDRLLLGRQRPGARVRQTVCEPHAGPDADDVAGRRLLRHASNLLEMSNFSADHRDLLDAFETRRR